MTALIVFACILLFLFILLSLKATVCIAYNGEVKLYVRVLFVKINILPKKKKSGPHSMSTKKAEKIKKRLKKKAQKKKQKALEKKKKKQEKKELKEQSGEKKSMGEILDTIKTVTDIAKTVLKTFFGHLKIKVARLHINIATGDAATTAIAYGAVSESVFYLCQILKPLDGVSLPKAKDFSVNADYLSESSTIDIKIAFSIRVWHVLHVGAAALVKFIKHTVKSKVNN